jgi:two-component system, response regulator PdtaR
LPFSNEETVMPSEASPGPDQVRVLIADDASIVRLDLRQALAELGYEVCGEAANGNEAVRLAETEAPDLIVMDIKMPELDGIEAVRRILQKRSLPVVMLTAYGDSETISRAVEAGVFAYLVKPYRTQDLKPAIEAALARHADREAARAGSPGHAVEEHGYYLSGYGYVA